MNIAIAKTVTGTVHNVIRHGHTKSGNPMMTLVLELQTIDGFEVVGLNLVKMRLQNDSGIAYQIENNEYRDVTHTYHLTPAGHIQRVSL